MCDDSVPVAQLYLWRKKLRSRTTGLDQAFPCLRANVVVVTPLPSNSPDRVLNEYSGYEKIPDKRLEAEQIKAKYEKAPADDVSVITVNSSTRRTTTRQPEKRDSSLRSEGYHSRLWFFYQSSVVGCA